GVPHCPNCGKVIQQQTVDQMVDQILLQEEETRMQVLAPVVRGRKGEHTKLMQDFQKQGYVRVMIDGDMFELDDTPALDKQKKHDISIVIDRLIIRNSDDFRKRLADSLETAAKAAEGLVLIDMFDKGTLLFSQNYACPDCGISIEELSPRMFSFNSPFGACPSCDGLGTIQRISPDTIVPDDTKSIAEGAIQAMGWNFADGTSGAVAFSKALAIKYGFSLDTPFGELPQRIRDILMYGTGNEKITVQYESAHGQGKFTTTFEGVITSLMRRYRETSSEGMKAAYEEYMSAEPCETCGGRRLRKEALAVTIGDKNISEVTDLSVVKSKAFFRDLDLTRTQQIIAAQIRKEIDSRLTFLDSVGLSYLTLSRAAGTLSGGEAQRIRLATQIGSSLMGVLYILDEPSIGLHQRDNSKLIGTLKHLRDLGNT
ncbi:MAG: excinuclease ABC subunit UvrA, partial [Firmicutes bacterium]|nr:excinuclease ABC subunit UvrA [Bacillota bacterium]